MDIEIKETELYKKFAKALNLGSEMRIEPNPFVLDCIKIAEQHAESKQGSYRWVSVEERLPDIKSNDGYKKSISVLVLVKENQIYQACHECNNDGEPEFNQWFCPAFDDIIDNVTHWMPIPEPPKP